MDDLESPCHKSLKEVSPVGYNMFDVQFRIRRMSDASVNTTRGNAKIAQFYSAHQTRRVHKFLPGPYSPTLLVLS
ncbi:hypothetical protein RRG08_001986 [Elysia crispata]|uniref:Uncharacterized protein n=1 Tax=Elysia crispata TaxID=231223 RepID=A0AAE1ECN4_9GAST|nr:hypothetical protein RRG08_001986 [Elysia crispata]